MEIEQPLKIIGLGGNLGQSSRSLSVLKLALKAAEQAGAKTELLDMSKLQLPFFVPGQPIEAYSEPETIKVYLEKTSAADGFIWASPVYHGSMSAPFKNALDLLELLPRRPRLYLEGKVVGMLAVAAGQIGAPMTLTAMWQVARALKVLVAPASLSLSQGRQIFDSEGNLVDERIAGQVAVLGREVTELTRLYRQMPSTDDKRS